MDAPPPDRSARRIRQMFIDISVLVAIGVVLGVLAPLGTGSLPPAGRIAYWVVLAVAGYLFYKPIGDYALRHGSRLELPTWGLWIAGVLLASIPMATLVWVVNYWPPPISPPSLEVALVHYFFVAVVGAVITLLFNLMPATSGDPKAEPATPASPPAEAAPGPRFLDRLPPALGSDLLALEMEDHYVRAHTALGSELVLMRMRDAVAELDGLEGEQVHRSWWVAKGAVADVRRDGRNIRLVLDGGLEAPVARGNVAALRERGWL